MNTTFSKISIAFAVVAVVFGMFTFFTASHPFVNEVYAIVGGSGSCGDCGDTTTPTSPSTPTSNPNPPVCNISINKSIVKDGENYTVSWNGTPSSATFKINGTKVLAKDSITVAFDGNYDYFRYVLYGSNSDGQCSEEVVVYKEVQAPVCDISLNLTQAKVGDAYTVTWNGTPSSADFKINGVNVTDSGSKNFNFVGPNFDRYTMTGTNGSATCSKTVEVTKKTTDIPGCTDPVATNYNPNATEDDNSCDYPEEEKDPITCQDNVTFTANPTSLPTGGGSVVLAWTTTDVESVKIDGEVVPTNDSSKTVNVVTDKTFTLVAVGDETTTGNQVSCPVKVTVKDPEPEAPKCVDLTADKTSLPYGGGDVVLTWDTENAPLVKLNGVVVAADDTKTVTVTNDITYTIVASLENGNDAHSCEVKIEVGDPVAEKDPITCTDNVNFTASPTNLPVGGGNVTLTWLTTDVKSVKIDGVTKTLSGSTTINVTADKIFNLVAVGDSSTTGNQVSCPVNVNVDEDTDNPLKCTDVSFTASDTSVTKGSDVKLSWSWNSSVTKASISGGIGDVSNNGSKTVNINGDITYYITIENADSNISCPLSINSETGGGGGGGSSRPRCDLDISDEKIRLGEEITLTWDTSRATEVVIEDNHGNIVMTTEDKLSKDKDDWYDGKITLKPTKDTKYTLTASRGTRDRECEVEVEITGGITVLETRNQEPRVAGISLTQVPYTGFEAGTPLTILFYTLLTIWALFVAYVLVIKRDNLGGVSLAGAHEHNEYKDMSVSEAASARMSQAAAYVSTATATVPHNLPTEVEGEPMIGYAANLEDETETEVDEAFTELENHAHMNKALISSDAMRYFAGINGTGEKAAAELESIIAKGKAEFPSEDGWLVLNLERIENLMSDIDSVSSNGDLAPTNLPTANSDEIIETVVAEGMGSLAEAIVTGNIVAAYQMISRRPMVALADAAADLDALYRMRKGESASVSDLLMSEADKLSDEQLATAIAALTGALDGTYSSEAEAVKMAIMKAVRALS